MISWIDDSSVGMEEGISGVPFPIDFERNSHGNANKPPAQAEEED